METVKTQGKSEVTKTFMKVHLKAFDSLDKVKVVTTATAFTQAKRKNEANINNKYNDLVTVLREMETKYQVPLFNQEEAEWETIGYVAKNLELATQLVSGKQTYHCNFNSVAEANQWLATQNDIEITDLDADRRTFGFIIHKIHISTVKLQYSVVEHGYEDRYQIEEIGKLRMFASSNWDKFKEDWKNKHPQFQYKNAIRFRASGSLIGGSVGFLRFVNEKFLVLYKVKG